MKHVFLIVALALAGGLCAAGCKSPSSSTSGSQTPVRVSKGAHSYSELIDVVANSPERFEFLLGTKLMVLTGPEMADRLRKRYENAGSPDMSLTRWVDKFGTYADGSSGMYHVKQADGSRVPMGPWLKSRIAH
jgi:hypothetical protein